MSKGNPRHRFRRQTKRTPTSLVDAEINKRIQCAKKKQKKQQQQGITITNEKAKSRYLLKDFPTGIRTKMTKGSLWVARINFKGNQFLVEPNTKTKKPRFWIQTLEGKKVIVTPKAEEEIHDMLAEMFRPKGRGAVKEYF